jgi:hypothetical protein
MVAIRNRTDYGVRQFDLSTARDNVEVVIKADNLAILEAEDNADIRINSPTNSAIPVRSISSISIPPKDDKNGIQRIYLSNPAGTGTLTILSGFAGASGSTSTPSDAATDITDRAARELGKARVEDSAGVLIDPFNPDQVSQVSDSTTTATNYATIDLGATRTAVGIVADVSGSATLTIEVSSSGSFAGEEHAVDSLSYSSASTNLEQYDFAYQHVRASVNQNLTELEIVGRGI